MPEPKVRWRTIKTRNFRESDCECPLPDILDGIYKGDLLTRIRAMEVKKPISFSDAITWIIAEISECYKDKRLIEAEWNLNNFVEWISLKGYHIVLTGAEFETAVPEGVIEFGCVKQLVPRNGKQIIKWKAFKTVDRNGYPCDEQMPEVIEKSYRGNLLTKILLMPEQNAISFEDAIHMVAKEAVDAVFARKVGSEPGHYYWYINNFVEYIASQGFHIELTGDEFDAFQSLAHVAFA